MTSESGSREVGVLSAGMFHLQTFGGCIVTHDGAPLDALSGQRKVLALMAVLAASAQAVTAAAIRAAARTARFAVSWNWLLPVIPRSDSDEGSRLRCSSPAHA